MKKLTAQDPETKSPDLAAENLAKLRVPFPALVTEGKDGVAVNLDVLKALVGDETVTDGDEKYGMNWHGKRRARQLALTPSTGKDFLYPDNFRDNINNHLELTGKCLLSSNAGRPSGAGFGCA